MKRSERTLAAQRRGFTLIELMIVVAVIGVLATLGLPAMRDYVRSQRIKTVSFDLFATLTLARSEAIKRNGNVVITQGASGWEDGWTIMSGTTMLRSQSAMEGFVITTSPAVTAVAYTKDGRITTTPTPNTAVTFTVNVSPSNPNITPRCISVDISGLPKNRLGTSSGCV